MLLTKLIMRDYGYFIDIVIDIDIIVDKPAAFC